MQRTPANIAACLLLASVSLAGEVTTNSTSLGSTTNTIAPLGTDQALYWKNMGADLAGQKPSIAAYVPDDKYKLRIGDRVSFQVTEDRDSPKSLVIADSGELDVPYLGRMAAVDKTCKQLAADIKTQLEKEFYYRASVVLALDSANHALDRVYVWGQVRNQGPIEIARNENLTVGKAILRAGGFADFASKKKVKIVRQGVNGATKQVFELNMIEILEDGQTEKDLALQADDSVIVPSRLINF